MMGACIAFVLFLQVNVLFAMEPIRTSCHRDGNFHAKDVDYSLSGNILGTHQVSSSFHCALECMEQSECKSFNYQHQTSTQSHACELLSTTKADGSLTARTGYTHYETQRRTLCHKGGECKHCGTCNTDCLKDEQYCTCVLGFKGSHCEIGVPPIVEIHMSEKSYIRLLPHVTIILNCFSSYALTHIWYKDGITLDPASTQGLNIFTNGSLEIESFEATNEGYYQCVVSNPAGSSVSRVVNVRLFPNPYIAAYFLSMLTTADLYTILTIYKDYYTKVDGWYKDGIEIATDNNIYMDPYGYLILIKPKRSDSGVYKVKASNIRGTVYSKSIHVTVLEICPILAGPSNGWRRGFQAEGYVTHFQCNFKYTMVGSSQLVCQADGTWSTPPPTCTADTSDNHPVRLTGSTSDNEGNVEIYSGGQWGKICHHDWDINDAKVVCKQLGFPNALRATKYSEFGVGTGAIFFKRVACAGDETELKLCSTKYGTRTCSHKKTAGVVCQNLRLAGGNANKGRLEVYTGGRWGTVCDDRWNMDGTAVACRQLGFQFALEFSNTYGAGDIVLDEVECYGGESNLLHCSHATDIDCSHPKDVSIKCSNFRLAGTTSYREGRVEKFVDGAWGTVCDDLWEIKEAIVLCRQLGFPGAVEANGLALYGQGTGEIIFNNVQCTGDEATLGSCPRSTHVDCQDGEDAGVVCQAHVRLAGSSNYYEGRVEAIVGDTWGTVCDNSWDINDAHVVCRMLGFFGAVSAYKQAYFGQGNGPVHWDSVECDGTETRLHYCKKNSAAGCDHSHDAGVRCQVLRLAGSGNNQEGRVELYQNNQWGTLCDKDFQDGETKVICNRIGRSMYEDKWNYSYVYGQGKGVVKMSDINCAGTEGSIFECTYSNDTSNCSHANDISVRCNPGTKFGIPSKNSGDLLVFKDDRWGRVCANHWDFRDADVACREMRFLGALQAYTVPRNSENVPILRDGLHCEGHEASLGDCRQEPVGTTCTHEARAVCQNLRLMGRDSSNEGRVEIFMDNIWGTICDRYFDIRDAHVVCMQLGFENKAEVTYSARDYPGLEQASGVVWMENFNCQGTEERLMSCPKYVPTGCTHDKDVWVKCII